MNQVGEAGRVLRAFARRFDVRSPDMSTPPSYLMMLRGGGAMKVVLFFNPAKGGGWELQISFTRASQPGSSGSLRAGEGAWADRPLSPGEANNLHFHSSGQWHPSRFEFDARTRRLAKIDFSGNCADAKNLFEWATTENQLFYVHAFNPPWAGGVLIISKVGP